MMKSGTFSKRSEAATKGLESCEFWFQAAFCSLNTALYFLGYYVYMEENNLKISLALYIRLELLLFLVKTRPISTYDMSLPYALQIKVLQ